MNWTLTAVIVILALFAIIGLKRGIVRMVLSLVFSIIGVVAAIFITPYVTSYVKENTEWDEQIKEYAIDYLPDVFHTEISDAAAPFLEEGIEAYNQYVAQAATDFILSAIVYLVVFVGILIICSIIGVIINAVARLPVIRTANDIGGMVVGLGLGAVLISILMLVLMVFGNQSWAEPIYKDIESSAILSFMYNKNLILIIIAKIF